eukprot:CAMPEP_0118934862 /NCGR_PEP_ID=MMETSP1169-20130426/14324_1 /TAXON_ID=36882 /ORGANISM="Pyramimonas obovata, Strain CCMP722" /LENGTH=495 /DNA_ID=CAMNT_0006877811 /DNA_START=38 /DNA_END=1525 /DNA_ORIENTATION=-
MYANKDSEQKPSMHPKQKELLLKLAQVGLIAAFLAYISFREIQPMILNHYGISSGGGGSSFITSGSCKGDLASRVPQAVTLMDIAFPWKHVKPKNVDVQHPWNKPRAEGWTPKLAPAEERAPKWIVITSINAPTEQVEQWSTLHPEWRLVIVGDKKSPEDFNQTNCVFLPWTEHDRLGFSLSKVLPYNSYSRKMLGYLYAIQHGAALVYETDDDNGFKPTMPLTNFLPEKALVTSLQADPATKVANPYAHFGIPTMWPRGYPINAGLDKGIDADAPLAYGAASMEPKLIPIQQALADLDPDVDAIFRLVRAKELGNFKFNPTAPPLSYPAGVMSPYNSQNTVHYASAFWGLYIPGSVAMRVCDIWRSYWAQRLLWEIGGEVAFLPASVDQVRSPHDYLGDFLEEVQMYTQAGKLVAYLRAWECGKPTLFDCAIKLTHDMAVEGYWGATDVEIMTAWLTDLYELGVENPPVTGTYTPIASGSESTITTMTGVKVRK